MKQVMFVVLMKSGGHLALTCPEENAQADIRAWVDFKFQKLEPFLRTGKADNGQFNFAYDLPEVAGMYYYDNAKTASERLAECQERIADAVEKQTGDGESWKG